MAVMAAATSAARAVLLVAGTGPMVRFLSMAQQDHDINAAQSQATKQKCRQSALTPNNQVSLTEILQNQAAIAVSCLNLALNSLDKSLLECSLVAML
jgi:hypothetical protein